MILVGSVQVAEFFRNGFFQAFLQSKRTGAVKAAKEIGEEVCDQDVGALARSLLIEKGPKDVPVLDRGGIERDNPDATPSHPGFHVVSFHVPFVGSPFYFQLEPSAYALGTAQGVVRGSELAIYLQEHVDSSPSAIAERLGTMLNTIEGNLASMRRDLERFMTEVTPQIVKILEERRVYWAKVRSQRSASVYPLRARPTPPPAYEPVAVKEIVAPPPPTLSAPGELDPAIHEDQYQDILRLIFQMGRVVEYAPRAFAGMGEESLRFVLLVPLNMRFEGTAQAEAFSHKGKTDIHIQHKGAAVFVAECKVWKGPKAYSEAIDQLLGYTTLRDTKTAIIVFNRDGEFTDRFSAIKTATERHPNFVCFEKEEGTTLRYTMRCASDSQKTFTMTVMVFDVPSGAA